MPLSDSRVRKRRPGNYAAPKPKSSKARSCEACRRLKTRCETSGSVRCHRCDVLKIECSFQHTSPTQRSPPPAEAKPAKDCIDCHSRLCALEATLTRLQSSMPDRITSGSANQQQSSPSMSRRSAREAPMNLIQEIRENITFHEDPSNSEDDIEGVLVSGVVSNELSSILLEGFSKLSSRWLFMNTDPTHLRCKSPLLFGTCILAGLHTTPSLHGSPTHQALYRQVHARLGQAHLSSSASLDTIQSMLICCMWDLRPTLGHDHSNSWLLSGTAAMRVIMTTPFDQISNSSDNSGPDLVEAQEMMRTWNLICLCQLQFSVGSGRPPVISDHHFDECAKVLYFPSYNSRDELVLAGVKLYRVLWQIISSNDIQKENPVWPAIDNLRKSQEKIYKLDSSEPLRFAYSCAYLILARHTLQHINEIPSQETTIKFIQSAIHHSHRLLTLFLSMSDMTIYIHPAYENLLCSFAMVTMAEFVAHIDDVGKSISLMEQAISHIQCGGKAEPVSRWSLNIMKQHVTDNTEKETMPSNTGEITNSIPMHSAQQYGAPWACDEWLIEQEFPSLEDMFFENKI